MPKVFRILAWGSCNPREIEDAEANPKVGCVRSMVRVWRLELQNSFRVHVYSPV